jgi:hypothetical protein
MRQQTCDIHCVPSTLINTDMATSFPQEIVDLIAGYLQALLWPLYYGLPSMAGRL